MINVEVIYGGDMMAWQLYEGDCLEIMPTLPDKSIDMILCDLPYGTTACKWDIVIPFKPLWEQYERLIKDNGAMVLFGTEPFSSLLRTSNLRLFKYDWIWKKTRATGFINCKHQPLKIHEIISVFSLGTIANKSGKVMNYNPQGIVYSPYRKKRNKPMTAKPDGFLGKRPSHVSEYDVEFINYPKSIMKYSNPNNDNTHPTQKPVDLCEYLIRTYTNYSDTVLDNCAGSGTTGVAAENLGRNSILIEREPKYCDIIRKRMANRQTTLFETGVETDAT